MRLVDYCNPYSILSALAISILVLLNICSWYIRHWIHRTFNSHSHDWKYQVLSLRFLFLDALRTNFMIIIVEGLRKCNVSDNRYRQTCCGLSIHMQTSHFWEFEQFGELPPQMQLSMIVWLKRSHWALEHLAMEVWWYDKKYLELVQNFLEKRWVPLDNVIFNLLPVTPEALQGK